MQKLFLSLGLRLLATMATLAIVAIGSVWSIHPLAAAHHYNDQFEHERFTLRSYIEKKPHTQSFTYTLELIELGEKPQVTLELGHKPFKNILITQERMTNETLVELTPLTHEPESDTKPFPFHPKTYTLTTLIIEGTPVTSEQSLTIGPWEIFALFNDEVFPISLKAQTLTWELTSPTEPNTWLSQLRGHPQYALLVPTSLITILLLAIGLGILLVYQNRLKTHRYLKKMIWKTIKIRYEEEKIEDLYYQANKLHYFKTVKNLVDETVQRVHSTHNLPKSLSETLRTLTKKLEGIVSRMTEDNKDYSDLAESSFTWIKKTFFSP